MKALVMTAPKTIEIKEFQLPEINDTQVLVKVKACGICTWEQRFYKGMQDSYPFLGGHEICGIVEKVGSEVANDIKVGDKVVVASLTRCGECYFCRRGLDQQCINSESKATQSGIWGPSGFSEYMVAKGYEVYKVRDDLDFAEGTVAEPLACVIRSIEKGNMKFGDTAVVLGTGIMGLLHVKLAKLKGARVIVSEPDEARRKKALECGADYAVDPFNEDINEFIANLTEGRGAEAVFFTAGGTKAVEQGISLLCKGGTIVLYGSIHPKANISIDPNMIHYDDIVITGAIKHSKESFRESAALLSEGIINVKDLISEVVPYENHEYAFERAMSPETYRVVFNFSKE